jgi:hypothetical protein
MLATKTRTKSSPAPRVIARNASDAAVRVAWLLFQSSPGPRDWVQLPERFLLLNIVPSAVHLHNASGGIAYRFLPFS